MISEIEITDILTQLINDQVEMERDNEFFTDDPPYIQLVEADNFKELIITVLNSDTGLNERFKLTVERLT